VFNILNDIADSDTTQVYAVRRIEKAYQNGEISSADRQMALQQIYEYYRS
jgi:hypothetical protein